MVAGRHNLTRRALLGAGVALPVALGGGGGGATAFSRDPFGLSSSKPSLFLSHPREEEEEALRQAQGERDRGEAERRSRWHRAVARFRRAEARLAAFKRAEARLPAAAREWPQVEPLERRFGDLDDVRLAALRRLLRVPAPDLAALSLKLDLVIADAAWELTGCETCLAAIAADARRLAAPEGSA